MHIPAYGADGSRRRALPLDAVLRLESLKLVVVQRNRKGAPVCVHFYGESHMPVQTRLKAGTRYSYREQVATGHTWTHHRLPHAAVDAALGRVEPWEVVDAHVRAMYRGVELS